MFYTESTDLRLTGRCTPMTQREIDRGGRQRAAIVAAPSFLAEHFPSIFLLALIVLDVLITSGRW